ncbi:MAG: ATP-binding cassette domain-containing protein [Lachnospiraceae bacterium]|nr:ATP-binding cassette domain-containing protein [Lachnospiraceae bacterium]
MKSSHSHKERSRLIQKSSVQKFIIILFWLSIWQLVAAMMHNNILLVGPFQVGKALLENISRVDFLKIIIYSFGRIGFGFLLAFILGFALGALSYRLRILEAFLAPLITTLQSIPVASFVVLLLIWFGSEALSFFSSFLVVFPSVYVNTMSGFKSTDKQLLEMADVFHVKGWNRFFYLYRPALMPYLISCLKISLGMSWKSGVAAEVIGIPRFSLGERLYMSKIYLDTAGLFAWTLMVILLSFIFEKTVLYLIKTFAKWKPYPIVDRRKIRKEEDTRFQSAFCSISANTVMPDIHICNLSKAYGKQQVIMDFTCTIKSGGHYCIMAPSGSGKTTLLRLINRIERSDAGKIDGLPEYIGTVFQEDRLCEEYDVISNIMLTMKRESREKENDCKNRIIVETVRKEALRILPEECLTKKVSELSGGMRRRCAILRAMLSDAELLIMDEPFTGLDDENREKTAAYILDKLNGRTLIVSTHREEDVKLLGAIRIKLRDEKTQ